ncbi:MAG: FtsX-like permease family protein [Bacteroidales bacterium]|nr:FtsX-like permease family protein [Bacteroidales bacterium]
MDIKNTIQLNIKKLKKHKVSARYLIIPIALLITLVIIISSQVTNFREAIEESVFSTVKEQNKLFTIEQRPQERGFGQEGGFNAEDLYYTESDIETILSMDNIEAVQTLSSIPISNIVISDLFENTKINISQLAGLESDFAFLYTDQDFIYTQDQPIPIILNANNFIETYEDWSGQDEIAISMGKPGQQGKENTTNNFPIKQKAIDYDKSSLIGKEITIEFGGLDEIKDYTIERGASGLVFKKLSSSEIEDKINARKNTISQYWDYDKISMPLKYTFKVVGIIEDQSNSYSFIPQTFVDQLMVDYVQNQLNARNDTAISTDLLNTTFKGILYDGIELISTSSRFKGRGGQGGMVGNAFDQSTTSNSYNIPGFFIQVEREDNSKIIGEYNDPDVYKDAVKKSDTLLVKIDDVKKRNTVINALNDAGYAYQDLSHMGAFEELESTLNTVSEVSIIAFIVLSILVIIFTMGKFITEGKKEIGILRAVGATKSDIKKIFITQAFIYVLIGYLIGLVFGIGLNFAIASPAKTWFDSFISKTVKESFGVANSVDASIFFNINFEGLAIYSAILLIITILVSFVPATKASNISPVEAIRSNE